MYFSSWSLYCHRALWGNSDLSQMWFEAFALFTSYQCGTCFFITVNHCVCSGRTCSLSCNPVPDEMSQPGSFVTDRQCGSFSTRSCFISTISNIFSREQGSQICSRFLSMKRMFCNFKISHLSPLLQHMLCQKSNNCVGQNLMKSLSFLICDGKF